MRGQAYAGLQKKLSHKYTAGPLLRCLPLLGVAAWVAVPFLSALLICPVPLIALGACARAFYTGLQTAAPG